MEKIHNIFISHFGKDDKHVQRIKERLKNDGYEVRNYSVDSTNHENRKKKPSENAIERLLKRRIQWSSAFICIIGPKTHTREWVNKEIKWAHDQGKRIIGIYAHGYNDNADIPENLEKYSSSIIGWNSLDKLGEFIEGNLSSFVNPDGTQLKFKYESPNIDCN